MAIVVTFAILIFLFFFVRRHIGPSLLAMIAGHGIYATYGSQFVSAIHNFLPSVSSDFIDICVYVALVLVLPLILYFRSPGGGLHGILRTVQALAFAAILAALLAKPLAIFFSFDSSSTQLYDFIKNNLSPILMTGIITAYLDIIFYRAQ